jgi:hypothetical protein
MNQLSVTLIVVIGLLGGFYGGFKYGQGHPPPSSSSSNSSAAAAALAGSNATGSAGSGSGAGKKAGRGGSTAAGKAGLGGNALTGQITSVENGTITVHDARTGQNVKVNVSSARVAKTTGGSTADLTQNAQVTVIGTTDSTGTVNATTVTVGGGLSGVGGSGGQPAPTPSS